MDGTIINSNDGLSEAVYSAMKDLGISKQEMQQKHPHLENHMIGMHFVDCAKLLKDLFDLAHSHEHIGDRLKHHFASMKDVPSFIHGFEVFLDQLKNHGIKHGIGTNADRKYLGKVDEHLDLKSRFDEHMYCLEDVDYKGKPNPDIFLLVAKKLGVEPSECVVFEDSLRGFHAAKAAGMKCIAVKNPTNQDLLHHVDGAIDSYEEAIEILKKIINE